MNQQHNLLQLKQAIQKILMALKIFISLKNKLLQILVFLPLLSLQKKLQFYLYFSESMIIINQLSIT